MVLVEAILRRQQSGAGEIVEEIERIDNGRRVTGSICDAS